MIIKWQNKEYEIDLNDIKQEIEVKANFEDLEIIIRGREYVSYISFNPYDVRKCFNAEIIEKDGKIKIKQSLNIKGGNNYE